MKVSKAHALQFLKIALAAAIVFFLIRSGKLSLVEVSVFFRQPLFFVSALALMALAFLATFYRWKLLLSLVDIEVNFATSMRLSMLGQFFSTFMPGAVGGDLVKAIYVARRYPNRRTQSVATVLVDRLIGLFALLVLGAIGFLLGSRHFLNSPHGLKSVALAAGWGLVGVAVVGISALLWITWFPKGIPQNAPQFFHRLPMARRWITLYELVLGFQRRPGRTWFAFLISLLTQAINLGVLVIIAWSLYGPPPWNGVHVDAFAAAACLGLTFMALPLAPLGLGVGQVAFATIFAVLGMTTATFGTSIVTGYQLLSLILNLGGLYFYLSYKAEVEI